jgi:hypothetical protein
VAKNKSQLPMINLKSKSDNENFRTLEKQIIELHRPVHYLPERLDHIQRP